MTRTAATANSDAAPTRFRAVIAYHGGDFAGFQRQREGVRTVQGVVEAAVSRIANRPVSITGAGRTDSGVHATGQVISFDLAWAHEVNKLQVALNSLLPQDVAIRELATAERDFHPRFDAKRRRYEYWIDNQTTRHPLHHGMWWHVRQPLNVAAMNTAAAHLIGVHDFATFGQPPQGTVTIREMFLAEWQRKGDTVIFTVEANAFLYRMVRSLVGACCYVGTGRWETSAFVAAFHAADRNEAAPTAPPDGLRLVSVTY